MARKLITDKKPGIIFNNAGSFMGFKLYDMKISDYIEMINLKSLKFIRLFALAIIIQTNCYAQPELQRYLPLLSGTNSSVAAPDGFTATLLNAYVGFDELYDGEGDLSATGAKVNVLVAISMLNYTIKKKILGAKYSVMITIPLSNLAPMLNSLDDDLRQVGFANIFIQPIGLNWQIDTEGSGWISTAYAIHTNTGRYSPTGKNNLSRGFTTQQFSLGGTYALGMDKSWNISAVNRFEIHGKKEGFDLKPGSNWTMDWGVGKKLSDKWSVGVTGYLARQLQEESGSDAAQDKKRYAYQGIGGELSFIPHSNFFLQLRGYQDFGKVINAPRKTGLNLVFSWFL